MEKIDFHIHTTLSDGDFDINKIIELSKKNGCYKISITDHEVIKDYSNVGKENGIEIINGIEFNCSEKGLHILGYGIEDIYDISNFVDILHRENESVSYQLIDNLNRAGYDITAEKVKEFLYSKNLIYDYLDKRHIVKYLIDIGVTKNVYDTYKNLIGSGTKFYLPLKKISVVDIIHKIDESGGVAVLAHPYTLKLDNKELLIKIRELVDYGLSGIEVINGRMPKELSDIYVEIANVFGLIKTIGSDFHNEMTDNIGLVYSEEVYNDLTTKMKQKSKKREI